MAFLLRSATRQFRTQGCLRAATNNNNNNNGKPPVQELLDNAATFEDLNKETPDNDWATLPYPEGTHLRRDQSKKAMRPKTDPKETSIILFPGQGAQYVGMAADLMKFPGARDIFALASEVLKWVFIY